MKAKSFDMQVCLLNHMCFFLHRGSLQKYQPALSSREKKHFFMICYLTNSYQNASTCESVLDLSDLQKINVN